MICTILLKVCDSRVTGSTNKDITLQNNPTRSTFTDCGKSSNTLRSYRQFKTGIQYTKYHHGGTHGLKTSAASGLMNEAVPWSFSHLDSLWLNSALQTDVCSSERWAGNKKTAVRAPWIHSDWFPVADNHYQDLNNIWLKWQRHVKPKPVWSFI